MMPELDPNSQTYIQIYLESSIARSKNSDEIIKKINFSFENYSVLKKANIELKELERLYDIIKDNHFLYPRKLVSDTKNRIETVKKLIDKIFNTLPDINKINSFTVQELTSFFDFLDQAEQYFKRQGALGAENLEKIRKLKRSAESVVFSKAEILVNNKVDFSNYESIEYILELQKRLEMIDSESAKKLNFRLLKTTIIGLKDSFKKLNDKIKKILRGGLLSEGQPTVVALENHYKKLNDIRKQIEYFNSIVPRFSKKDLEKIANKYENEFGISKNEMENFLTDPVLLYGGVKRQLISVFKRDLDKLTSDLSSKDSSNKAAAGSNFSKVDNIKRLILSMEKAKLLQEKLAQEKVERGLISAATLYYFKDNDEVLVDTIAGELSNSYMNAFKSLKAEKNSLTRAEQSEIHESTRNTLEEKINSVNKYIKTHENNEQEIDLEHLRDMKNSVKYYQKMLVMITPPHFKDDNYVESMKRADRARQSAKDYVAENLHINVGSGVRSAQKVTGLAFTVDRSITSIRSIADRFAVGTATGSTIPIVGQLLRALSSGINLSMLSYYLFNDTSKLSEHKRQAAVTGLSSMLLIGSLFVGAAALAPAAPFFLIPLGLGLVLSATLITTIESRYKLSMISNRFGSTYFFKSLADSFRLSVGQMFGVPFKPKPPFSEKKGAYLSEAEYRNVLETNQAYRDGVLVNIMVVAFLASLFVTGPAAVVLLGVASVAMGVICVPVIAKLLVRGAIEVTKAIFNEVSSGFKSTRNFVSSLFNEFASGFKNTRNFFSSLGSAPPVRLQKPKLQTKDDLIRARNVTKENANKDVVSSVVVAKKYTPSKVSETKDKVEVKHSTSDELVRAALNKNTSLEKSKAKVKSADKTYPATTNAANLLAFNSPITAGKAKRTNLEDIHSLTRSAKMGV